MELKKENHFDNIEDVAELNKEGHYRNKDDHESIIDKEEKDT